MRFCTKCETHKPLTDFRVDLRVKAGVTGNCIPCNREYQRKLQAKKRAADPEKHRAYKRDWYARNLETQRAYVASKARARWARDPEGELLKQRLKYKESPFRMQEAARKRRAQHSGGAGLTEDQWLQILEINDNRCAYCLVQSTDLEVDHVVPLAKGGTHEESNIVPACSECNTSKNDKLLLEIFAPRLIVEQRRTVPITQLT
jgi:5-methylcytosine-specific restriction endonuclease McrA